MNTLIVLSHKYLIIGVVSTLTKIMSRMNIFNSLFEYSTNKYCCHNKSVV